MWVIEIVLEMLGLLFGGWINEDEKAKPRAGSNRK